MGRHLRVPAFFVPGVGRGFAGICGRGKGTGRVPLFFCANLPGAWQDGYNTKRQTAPKELFAKYIELPLRL